MTSSHQSLVSDLIDYNTLPVCRVAQDGLDMDGMPLERKVVTIDAGALIWSVAFGSSTAETRPLSMNLNWFRYKKFKDLTLATGLENGRIRTWDVRTGEVKPDGIMWSVFFNSCSTSAVGQLLLELLDHRDVIRDIKFAPDGSMRLVSGSRDNTLKVWDMDDDGNMMKTLSAGCKWIYGCAWSPDARMLCSVGDKRSVGMIFFCAVWNGRAAILIVIQRSISTFYALPSPYHVQHYLSSVVPCCLFFHEAHIAFMRLL